MLLSVGTPLLAQLVACLLARSLAMASLWGWLLMAHLLAMASLWKWLGWLPAVARRVGAWQLGRPVGAWQGLLLAS